MLQQATVSAEMQAQLMQHTSTHRQQPDQQAAAASATTNSSTNVLIDAMHTLQQEAAQQLYALLRAQLGTHAGTIAA